MKHDLKALIHSQQEHFDSLLRLANELKGVLESGADDGRLEKILDERARTLERVAEVDAPLKQAVAESPGAETEGLELLQSAVQAVLDADARCEALLTDAKSKVAEQMRAVGKGSAALKWYGDKGHGGSRFISVKH